MPEHKDWSPVKTRIGKAFAELEAQGIASRMNFTQTLTDGVAEILDPKKRGYAFFHGQDNAEARKTGAVLIAFGTMRKGTSAARLAIGREVRKALEAQGLYVSWVESPDARLYVLRSRAAHDRMIAERDAEIEAEEKKEAAFRKKVDTASLEKRLRAAVQTLGPVVAVSRATWHAGKKRIVARAKKQDCPVLVLPPLDAKSISPVEMIFVEGIDWSERKKAFAFARKVKAALAAHKFKGLKTRSTIVYFTPK